MLQKLVKQRKESASIYRDQNRLDLAQQEETQSKIISEFLPKQFSKEEIENIIDKIIFETKASSIKDMGKVIGELKKLHSDEIDFSKAGPLIKELLSGK